MKWRRKLFQAIALVSGGVLFVYLVHMVGAKNILHALGLLGANFLVLLLISGLRHGLRTLAWLKCIKGTHPQVGWFALFTVRLASEAIRYLSFLGPLGGEPSKVALMRKRLPLVEGVSSVLIENLTYAMSAILITFGGLVLFFAHVALPDELKQIGLGMGFFLALAAVAIWWVITGPCRPLTRLMRALGKRSGRTWFQKKAESLRRVEENISDFYRHRRWTFFLVFSLELAAHFTSMVEIYLILNVVGVEASFVAAFIIEALIKLVNFAFFFVPGQVGVFEGGNALILKALGLGASAGVILALIEKMRTLAWAGCGLIVLSLTLRREAIAGVAETIEDADVAISTQAVSR